MGGCEYILHFKRMGESGKRKKENEWGIERETEGEGKLRERKERSKNKSTNETWRNKERRGERKTVT